VWDKGDYQLLVKALGSHYPYNYYFYNGNVGSGLCLFSKFPIVEAHGLPFRIFQGAFAVLSFKYELFLGKGCLSCRLKTPVGYVRIYVLHTGTDYTHRMCQLYEAIQYVSSTSGEDPVIWCGDFNMIDDEPPYKLITETLGMKDAFEHNRLDTCSLPDNVWSHTWINKVYPPCRLDYVFYANNGSSSLALEGFDSKLALDGFVPGENYNYSDHSGIEVKFRLNKQHLSSVSRSSLRERFNGDILNSQLRRSFCDTLLSMKAHLESYKDPRLLCSLSRNPPLSFSILSLLLTVPLMFFL
jgi:sphingomyelin phosphodiesterase 2